MTALFHLITAARADYLQHREPETVPLWADLLCGAPLVGLMLFCLVAS